MAAKYFWDRTGEAKDPASAVELLGGQRARNCLADYYTNLGQQIPPRIQLPSNNAILMGGTTDELQTALRSDLGQGLVSIGVKDLMAIWYVRRKIPGKYSLTDPEWSYTETVVSIASLPGYWDLKLNDPDRSSGYRWLRLYTGYIRDGAVNLDVLVNQLLPSLHKTRSWTLKSVPVASAEVFLRSRTPPGLVMSEQGDSGLLLGDLAVVFDAAASQATIDGANRFITDPAATLHQDVANVLPRVTEQFMKDVGRCELRIGGDRTNGLLLKNATGGPDDPRLALRRFAGTDAGATSLSRFMTQLAIRALTEKGAHTAFARVVPRLPSDQTGILPGNAKQFFISVQRKPTSFEFNYEVEFGLPGFARGMDSVDLDVSKSWCKASMQISIGAQELAAGNLTGALTKTPQFTFHTEMTMASLNQQAG